ncbi:GNAT family acetyltransferase Nat4 [Aspergillus ambiguus]|uniref:N-terminal L-serine N(alpha)-acetyltransferase NAT4 n=1 Tax=Aspergillus ambiguus TaxID=176160 RepID=UPI003CCE0477
MPGSVQGGRIAKKTTPSSGRKSSRTQSLQPKKGTTKEPKPLPLVERVNSLSCEEFVSMYTLPEGHKHTSTVPAAQGARTHEEKYVLDIHTAKTIPPTDFEACFKLIEQTQSEAYAGSSVGWSPSKKRKEMRLPDMKYMILRRIIAGTDAEAAVEGSNADKMVFQGFLSFMVTYEDGQEVIYCYEIHLLPSAQGRGLGEMLMKRFAEVGRRVGVGKAMLTVFKSNAKANGLYKRLGYEVDEYSPRPRKLRNGTLVDVDYWILSRKVRDSGEDNQ